ncbi:hypothetical protein BHM03_00042919 [Ensete ventricosum]|nr:hypothetical protein BHM03_00042919 [Ensete ventricosum]
MYWVDAVGNSLGVHQELIEGIGSFLGWHKGVRQKKTETHRTINGGSREACQEDREAHWEHVGRSLKEDQKTHHKNARDCRIGGTSNKLNTIVVVSHSIPLLPSSAIAVYIAAPSSSYCGRTLASTDATCSHEVTPQS